MPLNKEQFLKQFTRQALDERISLFVGAGASINAGYPSWYSLLKPLAKELGTPLSDSTNYLPNIILIILDSQNYWKELMKY